MKARARCPHCVIVPMQARTNGFGGCYLECADCGYSESIGRKADPFPSPKRTWVDANGKSRSRYDLRTPGTKMGPRKSH